MLQIHWQDAVVICSFFAAVTGLFWLLRDKNDGYEYDDRQATERMLLIMSFGYWTLHCLSTGVVKIGLPLWEDLLFGLKVTALISYLLTFACVLSLPLNRVSTKQVE